MMLIAASRTSTCLDPSSASFRMIASVFPVPASPAGSVPRETLKPPSRSYMGATMENAGGVVATVFFMRRICCRKGRAGAVAEKCLRWGPGKASFHSAMAPRNRAPATESAPKLVVPEPPPPDELPAGLSDPGGDDDENGVEDLGDLLALSDEAYRDAVWYVWRRRTPGESVDRRSNPNAPIYVAKVVGAIDLDDLAKQIGGGSFRLCGFRNGRKFVERPFEVDGPRKVHSVDPKPAQGAAAPASQDLAAVLASTLERALDRIEQKLAAAPAPAVNGNALTIKDAIELAKMMRGEPQGSPDAALVQSYVGILKDGIALGASREAPTGTDWASVVEKSMPLLEKMIGGLLSRRPGVPVRRPAPAPARPGGSHAEVVHEPAPATPAAVEPEEPGESVRMAAVVDSLARAVDAMGTDDEIEPADFAVTVETILQPAELSMLRLTTTDGLMSELGSVVERFP